MTDTALEKTIALYFEAWNAPNPAASRAKFAPIWSERSAYTDPTVHVVGIDALVAHIFRVQERRPGSRVVPAGGIDAHNDVLRFSWQRVNADGTLVMAGIDVAVMERGRIARMIGFFNPA